MATINIFRDSTEQPHPIAPCLEAFGGTEASTPMNIFFNPTGGRVIGYVAPADRVAATFTHEGRTFIASANIKGAHGGVANGFIATRTATDIQIEFSPISGTNVAPFSNFTPITESFSVFFLLAAYRLSGFTDQISNEANNELRFRTPAGTAQALIDNLPADGTGIAWLGFNKTGAQLDTAIAANAAVSRAVFADATHYDTYETDDSTGFITQVTTREVMRETIIAFRDASAAAAPVPATSGTIATIQGINFTSASGGGFAAVGGELCFEYSPTTTFTNYMVNFGGCLELYFGGKPSKPYANATLNDLVAAWGENQVETTSALRGDIIASLAPGTDGATLLSSIYTEAEFESLRPAFAANALTPAALRDAITAAPGVSLADSPAADTVDEYDFLEGIFTASRTAAKPPPPSIGIEIGDRPITAVYLGDQRLTYHPNP